MEDTGFVDGGQLSMHMAANRLSGTSGVVVSTLASG